MQVNLNDKNISGEAGLSKVYTSHCGSTMPLTAPTPGFQNATLWPFQDTEVCDLFFFNMFMDFLVGYYLDRTLDPLYRSKT